MRRTNSLLMICIAIVVVALSLACGLKKGDVARGEKIFNVRCWNCHEKDTAELPEVPGHGPGLKGYVSHSPHLAQNGSQHENPDQFLTNFIRDGSMNMPPQKDYLSKQDLVDLIAYLKTL
jgi:mono/diheme cytochrome c family protein